MHYDEVAQPRHYAGDGEVDCKRAMKSVSAGYNLADLDTETAYWLLAALKYIWRSPLKNGAQDIKKAIQCLELALNSWCYDND